MMAFFPNDRMTPTFISEAFTSKIDGGFFRVVVVQRPRCDVRHSVIIELRMTHIISSIGILSFLTSKASNS
jgi:hypothetical protein